MEQALDRADRVLAVWSEAYFRSTFGRAELRASFVRQARDAGRIVPVLVEPTVIPDLYSSLIYVDLIGLDEATAAARLRERLTGQRPSSPPRFPAPEMPSARLPAPDRPAFAGRLPAVWNVLPRNPRFVGRTELLAELRGRLRGGEHTIAVQALHGLGGVGKTQLAIEYPHRFAADYELVWWLDAEQPALLASQLAALADPLGLSARDSVPAAVNAVREELRRRPGWLLVFDNAQRPQDLVDYQPGGAGHVLVTSRYPGWGGLGGRLEVDVLSRPETVALLHRRLPELDDELAHQLAAELGDLPLAAAQAAGYLESTGLPAADYLRRFRARRNRLLARGEVLGYQGRLDSAWALSLERLRSEAPAAVQLLQLAAFLAPEPIPLRLFAEHAELLAEPLRTIATDADELDDLVGLIVGLSLIRRQGDRIQVHRLVQAMIRHQLSPSEHQIKQERVLALLAAAHPGDPNDPANRGSYSELAPHVLATAPLADDRPANRQLVLDTASYLQGRGDSHAVRVLAAELLDRWTAALAPDHPHALAAAAELTVALVRQGEPTRACWLGEDTVERSRRALGLDHGTTLEAAAALTAALVQLDKTAPARWLGEDTVERSRRVLGPDNPTTLKGAAVLTFALVREGEPTRARWLGEDAVERSRRVLGPDHPLTLLAVPTQHVVDGEAA
jgi:hypothetical protein